MVPQRSPIEQPRCKNCSLVRMILPNRVRKVESAKKNDAKHHPVYVCIYIYISLRRPFCHMLIVLTFT